MTSTWHVRRQRYPTLAAPAQWDRVYQSLVRWSQRPADANCVLAPATPPLSQEVPHAQRALCPGLDLAPGPDGDH
jgi:hypothetical protein